MIIMPKRKDIEIDITIKMSRRLALFLGVGGWIWGFLSALYFSYVALTGENPIIDWTLGIPAMITYFFGLVGVWGIVFSSIIGALILLFIGAIIIKYREG